MKPQISLERKENTEQDQYARMATPSPLYVQIAESIINQIETGELKPGTKLPPERELRDSLGVTRATVRQAFTTLENRGLLIRRQGQGTFVAGPKIERQAGKLVPFTFGMEKRGFKIENKLISFEKISAGASMASELLVPVGELVYFIYRIRLLNAEPVLLERLFVPKQHFYDLEKYNFSLRSLYEVMETEYGVKVSSARQSLEPVNATEEEAQLLGIRNGAALMLERRVAFDQNYRPVEFARDLFRGDRFRFITEIAQLES